MMSHPITEPVNCRSVTYYDSTRNDSMEFFTDNRWTTPATVSDMATVDRHSEHMLQRTNADFGVKIPSFETVLLELMATTNQETEQSCMEHVMAVHTVKKANKNIAGADLEADSYAAGYRLPLPSKYVVIFHSTLKANLRAHWHVEVSWREMTFRR